MITTFVRLRAAVTIVSIWFALVFCIGSQASAARLQQKSNVIRVWSVGSPHTGALPNAQVPPELEARAADLGYSIVVENFRASGFPMRLRQAFHEHNEPELLTFDNLGILLGVDTPAGPYQGVLSADYEVASSLVMVYESLSGLQQRGWVILVSSASNSAAAKVLAMQPPRCQVSTRVSPASLSPDLQEAQITAAAATRAYLVGDTSSLLSYSDSLKMGDKSFLPDANTEMSTLKTCEVVGNERLAFVSLAATFTAQAGGPAPKRGLPYAKWLTDNALGQQSILAVLRKQDGVWRLFAISDDPTNVNAAAFSKVQKVSGLLSKEPSVPKEPTPAQLITAEGSHVTPGGRRPFGNFEWTPSQDTDVICEVAEFLVGDQSNPRERRRLFFLFGHEGKLSSGMLWGAAGRWRVWSINTGGDISLSESRSYSNW